jgi:hypothetical protein
MNRPALSEWNNKRRAPFSFFELFSRRLGARSEEKELRRTSLSHERRKTSESGRAQSGSTESRSRVDP